MPYPVKCLLEVNKDMLDILLVLHVLFTEDSKVENRLFYSYDVLRLWLESVKDDLQPDFNWMADEADCPLVLTQL